MVQVFHRLDALPVTKPKVAKNWKNWKELKVLTQMRKNHLLVSSFLDPLMTRVGRQCPTHFMSVLWHQYPQNCLLNVCNTSMLSAHSLQSKFCQTDCKPSACKIVTLTEWFPSDCFDTGGVAMGRVLQPVKTYFMNLKLCIVEQLMTHLTHDRSFRW